MSKVHTILDLTTYVKVARELAVLGAYEKSLSKYKTALGIASHRRGEVRDPSLRDRWISAENLIKNEIIMVQRALEMAMEFYNDEEKRQKRLREEEERSNRILMRDYNDNDNYNYNNNNKKVQKNDKKGDNYDPRWARFGGKKPFEVWKGGDANELKKPYPGNNNYGKKPPTPVFDERAKVKNNNIKQQQAKIRQDYSKGIGQGKYGGVGGGAGKAGQQGKGNNDKSGDKKDPREGKSDFFLHHYPEGEGPDGELIEMVEREVMERNPNVKFEDIAELEGAKNTLKEAVLLPLMMPDFFRGLRRPWKGVLLYGPPGTGKTMLAKALATQGQTTFFNVSPTTFASKWRGESEKLVRILFEMARFYAPSTIFIDEVDAIGQKRGDGDNEASRKVMAEMLVQMDGVSGKLDKEDLSVEELRKNVVMVLGATNLPWDLDDALRRRFEKRVYIPLPNSVGRREMFYINMKGIRCKEDVNLDELVKLTDGYSGADIANVCREASLMNMRKKLMKTSCQLDFLALKDNPEKIEEELDAPVTMQDFVTAVKNISKSVSQNDLKKYQEWTNEYSSK